VYWVGIGGILEGTIEDYVCNETSGSKCVWITFALLHYVNSRQPVMALSLIQQGCGQEMRLIWKEKEFFESSIIGNDTKRRRKTFGLFNAFTNATRISSIVGML